MNNFVPLAPMIIILIYNQVAPAHMVLISNNDNLQPSGPCSYGTETITNLQPSDPSTHGTQKQEQLICNQVTPAPMVLKQ